VIFRESINASREIHQKSEHAKEKAAVGACIRIGKSPWRKSRSGYPHGEWSSKEESQQ
jgi:hypothetical protein